MSTAEPDLRAKDLHLGYDDRAVVTGLDLAVPPGKITAIVGANACGKSTLLRALARLLAPAQGRSAWTAAPCTPSPPGSWPSSSASSRSRRSPPRASP